MNSNELTFEQVDEQLRNADLSQFKEGGKNYFTASTVSKSPADVLPMVCNIYRLVKPILQWIVNILPKKWAEVIRTFMGLMDSLCP